MTREFGPDDAAAAAALSDTLLDAARRALEAGMFETAYHALAGAMHGAEDAGDRDRLGAIGEEALRQQGIVDARAPKHRLSRSGGRGQGHQGWFETLAMLASSASRRLEGAEAVEHAEEVRNRWAKGQSPKSG